MTSSDSSLPPLAAPADDQPADAAPSAPQDAAPAPASLPVIALVGRPNVGKSTLFNRLTRSRQALVAAVPGTTRDRREGEVRAEGCHFRLVDTGGMDMGLELAFSAEVEEQIATAVAGADYLWVVLDASEGLSRFDEELHRWVLRQGKTFRVVVNKADNPRRQAELAEFYALGTDRLHPVSGTHGTGIEALLKASAADLPALRDRSAGEEAADGGPDTGPLRVALLGRPNVGKSSLLNRILGSARMIVSEIAGTTREAVETPFRVGGRDYVLVDTAGIRRKSRTTEHLEKLSVLHSLGALNWVHVAVLVVDASDEVAAQDARLARYIQEHQRAVVVAMNKWDRVGKSARAGKEAEAAVRERLRFLEFAAFVRTSATEGEGLDTLFREIQHAAGQYRREIQTADLNRVVQAAALRFPPPAQRGSPTRIYYGTQVGSEPPAFRLFTNHPKAIDEAYTRFFENQLRHHFGLRGTPLRLQWRGRRKDPAAPPTAPVRQARKRR